MPERLGVRDRSADDALEGIERRDRRDGDEDPDRGGDEGLGDAGHDRLGCELRRCARGCRLDFAQLVEGRDDADDRPEQADERGVISQRAEEGEALLELQPLQAARALHGLLGRGDSPIGFDQSGDHHRRLRAPRLFEPASRALHVAAAEQASEIAHEDFDVVAQRPVEPDALEHDGQRDDAQEQHEGEDPAGSQADHRALHSFDQGIHVAMAPSVSSSSAGDARRPRSDFLQGDGGAEHRRHVRSLR